jgi:hypothetical protein
VSAPAYDLAVLGSKPTGQGVLLLRQSSLDYIQAQDELRVGIGGRLE